MTMASLTTAHTPPRCSPHLQTIDKSSFIPKESTEQKSNVRCCDNEYYNSPKILHKVPTGTSPTTDANDDDDLLDDDEDNHPHEHKCDDFSTFLKEWDDFCLKFRNLTTYALATSTADSNMPYPIDDDDDDDDDRLIDEQPLQSTRDQLRSLHPTAQPSCPSIGKSELPIPAVPQRADTASHRPADPLP